MDENVRLAYLYDFYGEVLNADQRDLYQAFVFDDLSLQELAEERGISRQAVHDRVKRCIGAMEEYERCLGLIDKYHRIEELTARIAEDPVICGTEDTAGRERVLTLLQEITEVL